MVTARQVEISFYRGKGKQRGRGLDALAQVIERSAIPFMLKCLVPAAKRVDVVFMEIAAPKFAVVEKNSRQQQRMWEDKI